MRFFLFLSFFIYSSSFSESIERHIYIYNDEGVSSSALPSLEQSINQLAGKYDIVPCKAEDLKKEDWMEKAWLLIIPGGADKPYVEKLKGQANDNIRKYVENGGNVLGICAGAYYLSDQCHFQTKPNCGKNDSCIVKGDRPLKFFKGIASGPFLAHYNYNDFSGVRAAGIDGKLGFLRIYYNGGCTFIPFKDAKFETLAHYTDKDGKKPAIIKMKVGKGTVILSGVHFEKTPQFLKEKFENLKRELTDQIKLKELEAQFSPVAKTLKGHETARQNLFGNIFSEFTPAKKAKEISQERKSSTPSFSDAFSGQKIVTEKELNREYY